MMTVFFYNSLTRTREAFTPLVAGHVGIYVCGPTVYGPPHLGHAKSYITFDILAKVLRQYGYKVRYVQNITDVGHLTGDGDDGEDKIQKQARLDQVHPFEVVDRYMFQYFQDMARLRVAPPSFYVRASQHIGEQIEAVQRLIASGHAYENDGNVYFSVASFPGYGKLSGRTTSDDSETVRIQARTDKRNPRDFALWKKAEPSHVLRWNSPWGPGYPGWHIECSVMSQKYLGETFDIHGGGLENMFPHHDCEIAQCESLTGQPFVRYWVHNNMVTVDGVKMGKSLGNFKTCEDLLAQHSAEAIRAFLLQTHYRSPSNYTEEAIAATTTGLARLEQLARNLRQTVDEPSAAAASRQPRAEVLAACTQVDQEVKTALGDDLDTPGALACLYNFVTSLNRHGEIDGWHPEEATAALGVLELWADQVLGILAPVTKPSAQIDLEPIMELLIGMRREFKQEKRFDRADAIREQLKAAGITLEDSRDGTTRWRRN